MAIAVVMAVMMAVARAVVVMTAAAGHVVLLSPPFVGVSAEQLRGL
jgi:hypothetical protein